VATTLDTLVQRTRRFLRDYPFPADALTASITSVDHDGSGRRRHAVRANALIEVDYEDMLVVSVSTNNLTVRRGWAGSTAATHASAAAVLVRPAFLAVEIIDALNAAKDEMFPYIYKPVLDTSLSADAVTYEFTVPNMPGTYGGDSIPIPYISKVELKVTGSTAYRPIQNWRVKRGATPKIQFRAAPDSGTLRVHGFGPFPDLSASSDTVDALFPKTAERPLVIGAASRLLTSGEAYRSRQDTGARDDREAANRPGSSLTLANQLERRFEKDLARAAMPPMPKHVVSVL
jgi:hypothetical protein